MIDAVRETLTSGRLAHLHTTNADGSPQVSIVWTGVEGEEILLAHVGQGRKMANLARDPRVVLSVEAKGRNPIGLANHLIVTGTAEVVPGGAPELLQRLAEVYLGPGVKFPAFDDPPPGHVIHITPRRFGGVGPWAD